MDEQVSKEEILNKTLYTLVRQVGLTPEEASALRLSDLHLAGKSPSISVSTERDQAKTVELDLEAHRALVGWLVARPDSISDFLFLGHNSEPMDPVDIAHVVEAVAQADLDSETPIEAKTTPSPESAKEDKPPTDETMVSPPRPEPLPARPAPTAPPPTTPEMGVPPRDVKRTPAHPPSSQPQARVPGPGEPTGTAPPGSGSPLPFQPFPPPFDDDQATRQPPSGRRGADRFPRPVTPEPRSAPRPVREKKPRVPPKPVRRKGSVPAPVVVPGKEPDQPSPPMSKEPAPPPTPVEEKASQPSEQVEKVKPEGVSVKPDAKPDISTSREPVRLSPPPVVPEERLNRPAIFSFGLGGGLVILAVCVICMGSVGWFAVQSETGANLLAGLGLVQPEPVVELPEATESLSAEDGQETATLDSPLPTPTLPPTSTPTPLPPTNTPLPADTATPIPQATEPPPPTDTPLPTDTPIPTNTPLPQPPPATPTPAESPTPALKYEAPVLLEPEDGFRFIPGNTIILRWQPVDLAPDEQYAVRLVYMFNNQLTFQGANIKESEWIVPATLFGQIDGPDNLYEWFVVIERLNEDGSGTAISPESVRNTFTWR